MRNPVAKMILEARIWRDESRPDDERRRARRRFDYALNRVRAKDGSKPNAMDRLRLHMAAVERADKLNSGEYQAEILEQFATLYRQLRTLRQWAEKPKYRRLWCKLLGLALREADRERIETEGRRR